MIEGQIVTIYEDPISETFKEGKAKLIKKEYDLPDGLEYWAVRFLDDDGIILHRAIKAEGKHAGT